PTGSVIPGVKLRLNNLERGQSASTSSEENGRFSFLLLPPGRYQVMANKAGFSPLDSGAINIAVTKARRIEIHLQLGAIREQVDVSSEAPMIQIDNMALGRVVDESALNGLPLVTRNLAQISGLSPGVSAGVFNAGELGLGGMALSQIAAS